jgi:hypothetical protein
MKPRPTENSDAVAPTKKSYGTPGLRVYGCIAMTETAGMGSLNDGTGKASNKTH